MYEDPISSPFDGLTVKAYVNDGDIRLGAEPISEVVPNRYTLSRMSPDYGELEAKHLAAVASGRFLAYPSSFFEENKWFGGGQRYVLNAFATLPHGLKIHIEIQDVPVSFKVWLDPSLLPTAVTANLVRDPAVPFERDVMQSIVAILREPMDKPIAFDLTRTPRIGLGKPLMGFRTEPMHYVELFFATTYSRSQAIKILSGRGFALADDDSGKDYYIKAARDAFLDLRSWWECTLSSQITTVNERATDYHVVVRIADIFPTQRFFETDPEVLARSERIRNELGPVYKVPRELVACMDIETYQPGSGEDVPDGKDVTSVVFMISFCICRVDSTTPLVQFLLTTREADPRPGYITVLCKEARPVRDMYNNLIRPSWLAPHHEINEDFYHQHALIKVYATLFKYLKPDYELTFNGGGYDWPFIYNKARSGDGFINQSYIPLIFNEMMPAKFWMNHKDVVRTTGLRSVTRKISAEKREDLLSIDTPGTLRFDVMSIYKKLFPKDEKSSLNYFLKKMKIPLKDDISHLRLRDIYIRSWLDHNVHDMAMVAQYCVRDSLRCQWLCIRKNVISEFSKLVNMCYCSIWEAYARADGMKVVNMTASLAAFFGRRQTLDHEYYISMTKTTSGEPGKYPGAWVFRPKKGIYKERPITGLDFSSLYPSLMMGYNLSPEMWVSSEEQLVSLKNAGYTIHEDSFMFNNINRNVRFVRHCDNPRMMGVFPTILKKLFDQRKVVKKELEYHTHWCEFAAIISGAAARVADDDVNKLLSDIIQTQECFFDKYDITQFLPGKDSDAVRTALAYFKLDTILAIFNEDNGTTGSAVTWVKEKFKDLLLVARDCVKYSQDAQPNNNITPAAALTLLESSHQQDASDLDAIQKALKVFMNTFYGATGDQNTPLFLLELAGGVTSAGRLNIKRAYEYVISQGWEVVYGDTDSLYVMPPPEYFSEVESQFRSGKISNLELCSHKVVITRTRIDELRIGVNNMLRNASQCSYLTMAYEEVLFPTLLCGAKKYIGIAHVNAPNFTHPHIFVRGIETIKQGQSPVAVTIADRIMRRCLDIDSTETPLEITHDVLRDALQKRDQWDFNDFIVTATYKPNKRNIFVLNFIARMLVASNHEQQLINAAVAAGKVPPPKLYIMPAPGERFEFMSIDPKSKGEDGKYDIRGYVISSSKSNIMEFPNVARANGWKPDLVGHILDKVVGTCARFVSYDSRYTPDEVGDPDVCKRVQDALSRAVANGINNEMELEKIRLKILDDLEAKVAKNDLCSFVKEVAAGGDWNIRPDVFKKAWREAVPLAVNEIRQYYGDIGEIIIHSICDDLAADANCAASQTVLSSSSKIARLVGGIQERIRDMVTRLNSLPQIMMRITGIAPLTPLTQPVSESEVLYDGGERLAQCIIYSWGLRPWASLTLQNLSTMNSDFLSQINRKAGLMESLSQEADAVLRECVHFMRRRLAGKDTEPLDISEYITNVDEYSELALLRTNLFVTMYSIELIHTMKKYLTGLYYSLPRSHNIIRVFEDIVRFVPPQRVDASPVDVADAIVNEDQILDDEDEGDDTAAEVSSPVRVFIPPSPGVGFHF